MKERPILFTPENAQKCFLGTKTQTRRIMKPQPASDVEWFGQLRCGNPKDDGLWFPMKGDEKNCELWESANGEALHCPYGLPGERLWVREAFTYWEDPGYEWKPSRKEPRFEYLSPKRQSEIIERSSTAGHDYLVYKADGSKRSLSEWKYPHPIYDHCVGRFGKTTPGIHMPRWACRTVLEITAIRVERLQDISEEDCQEEGIEWHDNGLGVCQWSHDRTTWFDYATDCYRHLWESINGTGSWNANPWVWALTFRKVA